MKKACTCNFKLNAQIMRRAFWKHHCVVSCCPQARRHIQDRCRYIESRARISAILCKVTSQQCLYRNISMYIPFSKLPCCVLTLRSSCLIQCQKRGSFSRIYLFVPPIYYCSLCGMLYVTVLYKCSVWVIYFRLPLMLSTARPSAWKRHTLQSLVQECPHCSLSVVSHPVTLLFKTVCVVVTCPHMVDRRPCDEKSVSPSLCSSVCMSLEQMARIKGHFTGACVLLSLHPLMRQDHFVGGFFFQARPKVGRAVRCWRNL